MTTTTRPSGIRVELRGAAEAGAALRPRRGTVAAPAAGARRRGAAAAPLAEEEAIVAALEAQELDLVDAIPLTPGAAAPAAAARRRRGPSAAPAAAAAGEVGLEVPLGADESAVLLVERDGVYEWRFADAAAAAAAPPQGGAARRRRGGATDAAAAAGGGAAAAATAPRQARFTIALEPAAPALPGAARRRTRGAGWLARLGAGKVVAWVFRFVARPVLGGATRLLERNLREALIHVTSADPEAWAALPDDARLPQPAGRPARVLLLVHGTFSSTVGSFGALAAQPAGRALLDAALAHYDLVLGWDHRTLSVLPTDNAVDLAARLERAGFTQPPQVDALAFSRGGLVLRSLVEHVLPAATLKLGLRRAVFVACTNGGTELARPANWHRLLDRYTNLAAAGARAAALVPGFASGATLLAQAIRGLGIFAKALASSAVTDGAVPGIAAMDPDGDFVRTINAEQPGQPAPHQTWYCAVTSDFDPDRATPDPELMPPGLLLRLADKATDQLYGKPNDLVVHLESMTQIDLAVGAYVRERMDFGRNGTVHHCNYFAQPRTAQALAQWLDLPLALPAVAGGRATRRRRAGTPAPAPAAVAAPAASGELAAPAQARLLLLRSTQPAAEALARLMAAQPQPDWVVVERATTDPAGRATLLRYAHHADDAARWLQQAARRRGWTVYEAFDLHETDASPDAPEGAPPPELPRPDGGEILHGTHGSRFRAVRHAGARVTGVLARDEDLRGPEPVGAMPPEELAAGVPGPATSAAPQAVPGTARRRGRAAPAPAPMPAARPSPAPVGTAPARTARAGKAPAAKSAARKAAAAPAADRGSASRVARASASGTAARSGAAQEVACHFRAETDDEYVVQQVHTVALTISREQIRAAARAVSASGSARVRAARPLVVDCMPMLRLTMRDPADARVELPVPAPGAPLDLRFDLVAEEPGPAEVRVQVRQGPLPLLTLKLAPTVVATRSGTPRPLRAAADLSDFPQTPRSTDELRIVQMRPTAGATQYRFELGLPSLGLRRTFESALMDGDPAGFVASLYKRIEDRWAEHGSERAAFERDLRAIGAELFDALLPLELRQLLWQHRDAIGSVQVLSSEPFIPWELVHVRDPAQRKPGPGAAFLGEMGVVRWLIDGYPPQTLRLRAGKARYLVPDYPPPDTLPDAARERALVERLFGASAVAPEAEAVYALVERPGQFDLLHVACHGVADPADIDGARLEMPGRPRSDGSLSEEHVLAATVAREADLDDGGQRPIVVLNACQSVRGGHSLKGVGGFAPALVQGGAGVIVGSAWSVGDLPAYGFVETFYERFLGAGRREPLARAVAAARAKAREDGDATWLAYVVYGHPRAVVRKG